MQPGNVLGAGSRMTGWDGAATGGISATLAAAAAAAVIHCNNSRRVISPLISRPLFERKEKLRLN